MITTSWDDGASQDIRLAELLSKYNLPATFYWSVSMEKSLNMSRVEKFLTTKQCEDIAKNFEIGSHSMTHVFLTKTDSVTIMHELNESKKIWRDRTGQPINSFCYPRGYANQTIQKMTKEAGYKDARNTGVGNTQPSPDPIWTTPTVHVGINRKEYGDLSWQKYARKMLEKARHEENGIYHVFGHSWEIEANNAWDDLELLFKELT